MPDDLDVGALEAVGMMKVSQHNTILSELTNKVQHEPEAGKPALVLGEVVGAVIDRQRDEITRLRMHLEAERETVNRLRDDLRCRDRPVSFGNNPFTI